LLGEEEETSALDQTYAKQNLIRQPHTLVGDCNTFLPLLEHDSHEDELQRQAKDKNSKANKCRVSELQEYQSKLQT
jgi:hypothetical protein